jgi:hypothetical protein
VNLRVLKLFAFVLTLCAWPYTATAQLYETVGTRAKGMAGAFVAVADDSTATWWNPAGLAGGPFFNGVIEGGDTGAPGEWNFVAAFAIPSLGLSYYRLKTSEVPPAGSTGSPGGDRQDQGTTSTRLPVHVLSQFGITIGQSIGEHLVLGSTLKLVHADQTRGDLDVGIAGRFGATRFGAAVRNVRDVALTGDGIPLSAGRQVRVGAAYAPLPRGERSMIASVDADLTTTPTASGDERHVAGGVELWLSRRLGVRGGASVNTVGDTRPSISGGASVAVRRAVYADAHVTQGEDEATRGWGLALRVTF